MFKPLRITNSRLDRTRRGRPHFEEEQFYEPAYEIPVREKRQNVSNNFDDYGYDPSYADERVTHKETSFEDSQNSSRSYESSQRRRERPAEHRPRESSYKSRPRYEEEKVFVTETYDYQPKSQRRAERVAERRREKIVRATFDARSGTRTFHAQEDAENYYTNDWYSREPEPELRRRSTQKGYRRDRYEDSELGAEEATYDHMAGMFFTNVQVIV
jgi:hypothetical protein